MTPITFTLTPADFTDMTRFAMRRVPLIQKGVAIQAMLIFLLSVVIAGFLIYMRAGFIPRTFYIAAGLAIFPGVALIIGFFYSNVANLSYRMFIRDHGKDALNHTLTLEETGLRQQRGREGAIVDTLWPFETFRQAGESRDIYFFVIDPGHRVLMAPKRAFATPEAGAAFFDAVKAKIPSAG